MFVRLIKNEGSFKGISLEEIVLFFWQIVLFKIQPSAHDKQVVELFVLVQFMQKSGQGKHIKDVFS